MTFEYEGTRDNGTPRYCVRPETGVAFGVVMWDYTRRVYAFDSNYPKRITAAELREIANFCDAETERNQ